MSLYEDEELGAPPAAVAVGWSKGVKLMQSHIQVICPPEASSEDVLSACHPLVIRCHSLKNSFLDALAQIIKPAVSGSRADDKQITRLPNWPQNIDVC
jgi:hypothetical protein